MKSKLHRAKVTDADLRYEGSISIDPELLRAADLLPNEKVDILNINNGERFTTYTIEAAPGSREICINGAAARLCQPGDRVIIVSYVDLEASEWENHEPRVVLLNESNEPVRTNEN